MVVHLLGKQNIAFCKHRNCGLLSPDSTSKQNEGILNLSKPFLIY